MSKEAMKLALEALERLALPKNADVIFRQAITALREALAEQPAQQEPKIDIYRSFEQWKSGNVLEHGVPRTEHYSEAQLDLVEMGWNYGYDAGRAVEQALDKKAENARELGLDYEPAQQEPVAFLANGTRFKISYDSRQSGGQIHGIPAELGGQWVAFVAADDDCHLKLTSPPAQRTWVGLTDEEVDECFEFIIEDSTQAVRFYRAIEAKLKEKNNG